MRFSPLATLAGLSAFVLADEVKNPVSEPSVFNGKTVPPLLELTPANWEEQAKKNKFMMVKHFRYVGLGMGYVRYTYKSSVPTASTVPGSPRLSRLSTNSTIPRSLKSTTRKPRLQNTTTSFLVLLTVLRTMISVWNTKSSHTRLQSSTRMARCSNRYAESRT